MNIAIDIDDTLTDSFDFFQPYVAEFFGADPAELRARNISYSNLPPEWKSDELSFCRAYYDRIVPHTPFKPDAAWGIRQLRAMGHRIVIITGRNTSLYTDPYQTTRQELANGGIEYDSLICTLDKGAACIAEQIHVLIDDLPANCASAEELGIPAILFTSSANRDVQAPYPRVSDWRSAVETVGAILSHSRTVKK